MLLIFILNNFERLKTIMFTESLRALCNEFNNGDSPRYIFGRTIYAADIIKNYQPDGVIDDYTSESHYHGIPIIKLIDVPDKAIVVSAIVDGRPVTVNRLLEKSGLRCIDYFSFKKYAPYKLREPNHVSSADFSIDYCANEEKYTAILQVLADEVSKETFSRLVNFRLNEDLSQMSYFTYRPNDIYFEPFVISNEDDLVFVDVGCFDGGNVIDFIKNYPSYRSVHVVEPEPVQMAKIKERLHGFANINYHQYGASNHKGVTRFTSSGIWSHMDDKGDIKVKVNTIDALIDERISFIKMDIEGHEYSALEGARQHIIDDHPALAICAYHLVDDFWKLPELVLSFRQDYKIYMRHYTEGVLETVYYFVPVKKY